MVNRVEENQRNRDCLFCHVERGWRAGTGTLCAGNLLPLFWDFTTFLCKKIEASTSFEYSKLPSSVFLLQLQPSGSTLPVLPRDNFSRLREKKNRQHNCITLFPCRRWGKGENEALRSQSQCHLLRTADLHTCWGLSRNCHLHAPFALPDTSHFPERGKNGINSRAVSPSYKCCNQNSSRQAYFPHLPPHSKQHEFTFLGLSDFQTEG